MSDRRKFLKMAGLGWAALGSGVPILGAYRELTFAVAGVRFQDRGAVPSEGDPVQLIEEVVHGECAIAIHALGRRIGYVPRSRLGELDMSRIAGAWLARVHPHRFPWNRFRVTVRLAQERSGPAIR